MERNKSIIKNNKRKVAKIDINYESLRGIVSETEFKLKYGDDTVCIEDVEFDVIKEDEVIGEIN